MRKELSSIVTVPITRWQTVRWPALVGSELPIIRPDELVPAAAQSKLAPAPRRAAAAWSRR
jgi:hypothetical protein